LLREIRLSLSDTFADCDDDAGIGQALFARRIARGIANGKLEFFRSIMGTRLPVSAPPVQSSLRGLLAGE